MNFSSPIANWRSIRRFRPESVPDEIIGRLLESASRAPSWENLQPWRFIVITDPGIKEKLCALSFKQKAILRAPVVIACCGDTSAWERDSQRKSLMELRESGVVAASDNVIENLFLSTRSFAPNLCGQPVVLARTFEAVSYAIAFMLIEAVNQGLGACVIGAFGNEITQDKIEDYMKLKQELGVPDLCILLALVCLGYPDESPGPRPRKPLSEIAFRERWGQAF
ncbi:MAG: nitroreductase family protein [candidate division WOR-3 bacterium]